MEKTIENKKIEKSYVNKRNIVLFVYGLITSVSFIVKPDLTGEPLRITVDGNVLILTILAFLFYSFYKKYYNQVRKQPIFIILSIIFSLLLICGYSFYEIHSGALVYGNSQIILLSIIKLFGYTTFINTVLNLAYESIDELTFKPLKFNKYLDCIKKHPFKTSFILLFVVYTIYLIAFYPGVVGYDPSYQIQEFMGINNPYSESVNIINDYTLITQFNPVLHTLLIGGLFKIGYLIGNVNFGIFLYTLLQVISFISVLSYSIKFMFRENVPEAMIYAVLLIYLFVPVFPFYSICAFKDTYYAMYFILFVINLYCFIKHDVKIGNILFMALSGLGLCFFRSNGIATVLLSLIVLIICNKRNRRSAILSIAIIGSVYMIYIGTLDYLKITPTSPREVLSVPIQQISALIVNKEKVITKKDRVIISKVIDYKAVKDKYNPELADPVKNTYNKNATRKDLKRFLAVWFKYLIKEPMIYIEATINNVYGYFYPEAQKWYFYSQKNNTLNSVGIDYHYNSFGLLRKILNIYGYAFQNVPILSLFVNIGIITWIYICLVAYLVIKGQKKYVIILIPAVLTILMCIVGPVNLYYRYVIPYSMSLPVILSLLYINTRNEADFPVNQIEQI